MLEHCGLDLASRWDLLTSIEVVWATDGDPVFGADGTVSMRTTHVWSSRTGPGTFVAFSPADTETQACDAEASSALEIQPFGCAVSLEAGAEGPVSISWMREGTGLSHEWRLAEGKASNWTDDVLELGSDRSRWGCEGPGCRRRPLGECGWSNCRRRGS